MGLSTVGYFLEKSKTEMKKPKTQLQRLIDDNDIVMFTKTQCRYCVIAKQIFSKEGLQPFEVILDKANQYPNIDMGPLLQELVQTTKWQTVPQIFIHGKFIGGADQLQVLRDNGDLARMVSKRS